MASSRARPADSALDVIVKLGLSVPQDAGRDEARRIRLAAARELAQLRRKAKLWDTRFDERPGVLPGAYA